MRTGDLIEAIALSSGEPRSAAARVLDALVQVVSSEVAAGSDVAIHGLGTFKVVQRGPRMGRNPRTGEAISIGASKAVKFVPSPALRTAALQAPAP